MLKPVTLVTGASSGLGAALARVFAEHGDEVVLVARRAAELAALADRIAAAGPARPQAIALDLASADAGATLDVKLREAGLEPAVVVNCAGFGLFGAAADNDLAEQLAMIDLNARSLTELSLRWLDSIARHKGGVLNVSSIAAFMPRPGMAVYHATKAYALSFTEALHREMAPRGVRVTALCPGPIRTEFLARAGTRESDYPRFLFRSTERIAREGYEGFMRGERLIIPGRVNKVAPWLPRFLPRGLILTITHAGRRERNRTNTIDA